ncbi:hypothetical protein AAFF_G00138260 [Aldrovandia affinis]|uniref:Uncharacterized protein n=1 Tax=Aldrovandia affinis TaxID=143900 RepID=A0AAD7TCJ6_9TELE|nr:hypothetical protein AAFF_G00138260 [Aldrovandia affinis]
MAARYPEARLKVCPLCALPQRDKDKQPNAEMTENGLERRAARSWVRVTAWGASLSVPAAAAAPGLSLL